MWTYTPRQIVAFQMISQRRRQREQAELVSATHLATKGSRKEIKRQLRDWTKDM